MFQRLEQLLSRTVIYFTSDFLWICRERNNALPFFFPPIIDKLTNLGPVEEPAAQNSTQTRLLTLLFWLIEAQLRRGQMSYFC